MVGWDADPYLLRTFLTVCRHRNLTRAAEELYVTQPAVSRRIRRLERTLGLPLFERLGKALHLTEAGEALAAEAATLLGTVERLAESVRARQAGERGRLRIGASTTPGLYLLPDLLRRFQDRHPDVEVLYQVENSLHVEERLVRNDIDLAFVGAHLTHAALRARTVLEDEVVCYVAASHPLARRRTLGPRDLERQPWIVREPGSATHRLVEAWMRRARMRPVRTIQIACPEAAKVLVRAGAGVSYVSAHALRGEGGRGLVRLGVPTMRLVRPVFLVLHAGKRMSSPMQAFLDLSAASLGRRAAGAAGGRR